MKEPYTSHHKNLLLLLVSTVCSLVLLELLCRQFIFLGGPFQNASAWFREEWIERHEHNRPGLTEMYSIDRYDSLLGWTLRANLRNEPLQTWSVSSNSIGCRGTQEFSPGKSKKFRIVTIGDSFTFGENVNDDQTYPAQLEKMLDSVEVINLAVHGYGHDQQLLRLIQVGLTYQPDLVVLGFLNDDVNRNMLSFRDYAKPYFDLKNGDLTLHGVPVPPPSYFLHARIKSWGLIQAFWERFGAKENTEAHKAMAVAIIDSMVTICRQKGCDFWITYLPLAPECLNNKPQYSTVYNHFLAQGPIHCVDPTSAIYEYLQQRENPSSYFAYHYSQQINQIIAKILAREIEESFNLKNAKRITNP